MQGQNAAGWIHPTGGASAREKVANLIISHCRLFVVERTYSSPPPSSLANWSPPLVALATFRDARPIINRVQI